MADSDSDQDQTTLDHSDIQSTDASPLGPPHNHDLPRSFSGRATQRGTRRWKPRAPRANDLTLGVGDAVGTGDSYLVADLLPAELANVAFEKLKDEVRWNTMYHRGKCWDGGS